MAVNLFSKIEETSWFYEENEDLCKPHLGRPYISYSTAESYHKYTEDLIKYKLLKLPQPKKIYANFGSWVGEAYEKGEFPQENPDMFSGSENFDFSIREQGDEYEKMILIDKGEYVIIGFIDKYNNGVLCDQKTGGTNKEKEYEDQENYTQTILYSHGVELQGLPVNETYVHFWRRVGSHVNPPLALSGENFKIPLKYNKDLLDYSLKKMDKAVKGISELKTTYDKFFK